MKYLFAAVAIVAMLATGAAYAAGSGSTTTTNVTSDFPRAKKLVDAKNFTAAIPMLKKVVKSQPKNAMPGTCWHTATESSRSLMWHWCNTKRR